MGKGFACAQFLYLDKILIIIIQLAVHLIIKFAVKGDGQD